MKNNDAVKGLFALIVILLLSYGACSLKYNACKEKFPNTADWVCVVDMFK